MNQILLVFLFIVFNSISLFAQSNLNKTVSKNFENQLHAIHVIGNSHACVFSNIDNTIIHYVPAITMHRIGRDNLRAFNLIKSEKACFDLLNYNITNNDLLIFVFGEVDVRFNILKQRDEKKRCVDEILDTLVANYLNTIKSTKIFFSDLGIKVNCAIYNVTPPADWDQFIAGKMKCRVYGTLEERIAVTLAFNEKLYKACLVENIPFIDVYKYYIDARGILNPQMRDDLSHIRPEFDQPIRIALKKLILKLYPRNTSSK